MQTRSLWWMNARVLALGLCVVCGCSNAQKAPSSRDAGLGEDTPEDAGAVYCPADATTSDTLVVGLEAKGKHYTAKLVSASPSPPQRFNNDWVVDFVDADGNPVSDMQVTKTATFMPYHQHGKPGKAEAMSDPGRFKLTINLNMPGYFEIRLNVHASSAGDDYIVYNYCLR
jgi:YtkA-like protein